MVGKNGISIERRVVAITGFGPGGRSATEGSR